MKKIVFKVLIAALIISAVLGIGIIILGLWTDTTAKVLATTAIIFGVSIPGLCCSTIYEKGNKKLFSTIGMIACSISCLYFILLLWEIIPFDFLSENNWKTVFSLMIIISSFGHLSLVLLNESNEKHIKCLQISTIVLSVIFDILLLIMIIFELEIKWQIIAILAILIVLDTIIIPIMCALNNKVPNNDDKYDKLEKLKKLLDDKAITKKEYDSEKEKILNDTKN